MHIVCNNTVESIYHPTGATPRKGARAMKYGERVLLKEYKNGNRLWGTVTRCAKCDGSGKVIWSYADHVCFDCNGKGWYYDEERELTPANIAKQEATRAKERAKWEAEEAKREAARREREAEEARKEAERLAEIERNRGQFIGNVGDKITVTVTLVKKFEYETHFGFRTTYISGYVFKTDDGNTIVYKTSGVLHKGKTYCDGGHFRDNEEDGWYDYEYPEEGERLTIKGTIKEHTEYNNVNQTVLTRAKVVG